MSRAFRFPLIAIVVALLHSATAFAAEGQREASPLALLKAQRYSELESLYAGRQRAYEAGAISDEVLYRDFRALYEDSAENERYFTAWMKSFPKSYSARMARGTYYYRMGWFARGTKYIQQTPEHRIEQMHEYLAKANADLTASLEMTSKPYLSTLALLNSHILVGTKASRRQWLDRGNAIDPANMLLRMRYMFSLTPKWGGSHVAMRGFLEECERQKLPPRTLANLELALKRDIADDPARRLGAEERHAAWTEILRLEQLVGGPPSVEALMRQTRAAWDLKRYDEANRGLEQLTQMHVDEPWVLSQIGWMYTQQNRIADAWPVLLKAAEHNDAWSQFTVGKTIYLGCPDINLAADRDVGLRWIRLSANQQFAEAKAFLALAKR